MTFSALLGIHGIANSVYTQRLEKDNERVCMANIYMYVQVARKREKEAPPQTAAATASRAALIL